MKTESSRNVEWVLVSVRSVDMRLARISSYLRREARNICSFNIIYATFMALYDPSRVTYATYLKIYEPKFEKYAPNSEKYATTSGIYELFRKYMLQAWLICS